MSVSGSDFGDAIKPPMLSWSACFITESFCFAWVLSHRKKNKVREQVEEKWPNTEKAKETFGVSLEEQRPSANTAVQCSTIGNMHLTQKASVQYLIEIYCCYLDHRVLYNIVIPLIRLARHSEEAEGSTFKGWCFLFLGKGSKTQRIKGRSCWR